MFSYLQERFARLLVRLRYATRSLRLKRRPNIATLDLTSSPAGTKPFIIGLRRGSLPDTRALGENRVGEGLDEATSSLEEVLGTRIDVYDNGQGPSAEEVTARGTVIFCQKEEDVASEVRRLRALDEGAPILVLGLRLEPQLARTALLAGADGFVYPAMRPAQIVVLLEAASRNETLVPRDLFAAFLAEIIEAQPDLVLPPRQREFLELIAVLATSQGEIVVRRELLEAFLRGTAAA
jgi:hypothetical protein